MSRYLVLEGGDGCGKSAQALGLIAWLEQRGLPVLHVREPGSTPVGEALRKLLLDPSTGELREVTEALLFSAARAELVGRVIAPALRAGSVVVAERSFVSTLVYQCLAHRQVDGAGGLDVEWLRRTTALVHGEHMPDRIFVLDVPPEVAEARRTARTADRFEERGGGYLDRVRRGFLAAATDDPRIEILDATGSFDDVQRALQQRVEELLA